MCTTVYLGTDEAVGDVGHEGENQVDHGADACKLYFGPKPLPGASRSRCTSVCQANNSMSTNLAAHRAWRQYLRHSLEAATPRGPCAFPRCCGGGHEPKCIATHAHTPHPCPGYMPQSRDKRAPDWGTYRTQPPQHSDNERNVNHAKRS